MAKAILEFNLPEERQEFELATNAQKLNNTLWEYDQALRNTIKYNDEDKTEVEIDAMQKARDLLYEIMRNNNVSLE